MSETKRKVMGFIVGLFVVSFLSLVATVAFFEGNRSLLLRNVLVTDIAFTILYIVWLRLHKGYGDIYKSGLSIEDKK